ncbi:MAG TPA: MBL fold metallo-hydrolase [Solirubrobacteraceae bacterium]
MNDFTLIGGPTAFFTHAGLRWMTDPAFSPPGDYEYLTKLTGPAVEADAVGDIDVVLLSHDHHADNLDPAGREFLPRAGRVLTTGAGAERLGGNAIGLEPWASVEIESPDGSTVTVTAVPAQHGPDGTDEITGPVIGFVLQAPGAETVYVSGDNASLDVVRHIAERVGGIDIAVLFAGGGADRPALRRRLSHAFQRPGGRGGEDPGRAPGHPRALRRVGALHPGRRRAARRLCRQSGHRRAADA